MIRPRQRKQRGFQDEVYAALRNSIINLNLEPGSSISEMEISQKFHVSRTPVREAFIHLSMEGLVEVIPQKETRVSLIDPKRVEQEFFLRESLETAVLELFISKSGTGHFAEMESLISLQHSAIKSQTYVDFMNHDDRFHQILFEAAAQHLSWEVLSSMSGHYHRVRMLTILIAGIGDEKIEDHRKILTALKKGDIEKSKEVLYQHLHNLDAEEKLLLEKFPGYFVSKEAKNAFDVDFGGLPNFRRSEEHALKQ